MHPEPAPITAWTKGVSSMRLIASFAVIASFATFASVAACGSSKSTEKKEDDVPGSSRGFEQLPMRFVAVDTMT